MTQLLSVVFVIIWSTGFLVGRALVGAADPSLFLFIRFALASFVLFAAALAMSRGWPRRIAPRLPGLSWPPARQAAAHMGIGALVNGGYLVLAYRAIAEGLPAGIMALIGSWQPVLTVVLTLVVLRRRPGGMAVVSIGVSLLGVALVLAPGLAGQGHTISWFLVCLAFAAVSSLTVGTMMQKRMSSDSLVPALAWQALGAAVVAGIAAAAGQETMFLPTATVVTALIWSVLANSVLGMALMVHLVRKTSATYVSTIMLAAPPLAAVEALLMFDERLTWLQWGGIAIALAGVALTQRSGSR